MHETCIINLISLTGNHSIIFFKTARTVQWCYFPSLWAIGFSITVDTVFISQSKYSYVSRQNQKMRRTLLHRVLCTELAMQEMLCFLIHWAANHWRNIHDLLMPSQFTMILLWNFEVLRMALKEHKSETVETRENTVLPQSSHALPWWAEKRLWSLLLHFWVSFQVQNCKSGGQGNQKTHTNEHDKN